MRQVVNRSVMCFALTAALLPATAFADDEDKPVDVEGSHDHPAVKRYPGALITEFKDREFETFKLPVADPKGGSGLAVTKTVEGKYLDVTYQFPAKTSCTQVRRNY